MYGGVHTYMNSHTYIHVPGTNTWYVLVHECMLYVCMYVLYVFIYINVYIYVCMYVCILQLDIQWIDISI